MSPPRVSVVIPTYNQAAYLRETLESLLAQTLPGWEAVIVNNFSEDDTRAVIDGFADPRISVTDFRNDGVIAASRNLGIRQARADWIAFLDSDDLWRPEKLERCLAAATDEVDVLGHDLSMFRGGRVVRLHRSGPEERASYRSLLFEGACLTPSATLVRKARLDAVGGFSEAAAYRTAEDYELWLKLAGAGARFAFLSEPLTDYRMHDASASRGVARHHQATLAIVRDHAARLNGSKPDDAARLRRRFAMIHYGAARAYLAAGRGGDARGAARDSLASDPTCWKAYAAWTLGLIPGLRL